MWRFTAAMCVTHSHDGPTGWGKPLPRRTRWWPPGIGGWRCRSCCPGRCAWWARHRSSSPWRRPYRTHGGTWSSGTEDAMSSERDGGVAEGRGSVKDAWLPLCFSHCCTFLASTRQSQSPHSAVMHFLKIRAVGGWNVTRSIKIIIKAACGKHVRKTAKGEITFLLLAMIVYPGCFMLHSFNVMLSFRPFPHSIRATYWSWNW